MNPHNRTVLLAVSGGIAAYKSAIICSRLVQRGYDVRVMMSVSATKFVGAATFAALSSKPVATDMFDARYPLGTHIELADGADLMVIAPATAHQLASLAHGHADDLITTTYLQVDCPVLLAPAMSALMWTKPSVQRNVNQLKSDGCHFVGPDSGWLSCRVSGEGRMSEPDQILETIESLLSQPSA